MKRDFSSPRRVQTGKSDPVRFRGVLTGLAVLGGAISLAYPVENQAVADFHQKVQPILFEYCYDCHGDGMSKGNMAFDGYESDDALVNDRDLWWTALRYLRSGIMPPEKKPRPSAEDIEALAKWVKFDVFEIDPENPDPGRVTLRRLNRMEYRNTIRDLMGVDFDTELEFPPDDTGYGFDTIGDVLTVSPLLLEKYVTAAEDIVSRAVPTVSRSMSVQRFAGEDFQSEDGSQNAAVMDYYQEAKVSRAFEVQDPGTYVVDVEGEIDGDFNFDTGSCLVSLNLDGQQLVEKKYVWYDHKKYSYSLEASLTSGDHELSFELQPLAPADEKKYKLDLQVHSVVVRGPRDPKFWRAPENYDRFFTREEPPESDPERREYAREILQRFVTKAFRRPVDDRTVERLIAIAEEIYTQPDKRFEEGIARAITAALASPRFLFRIEHSMPEQAGEPYSYVDEYALASRLSYFLWSTMPDEELFGLAERGELRNNLDAQVKRMLEDPRSKELVKNFTGQWLQARDIEGVSINERSILARDADPQEGGRRRRFGRPRIELDRFLRRAMRQETEMYFSYILHENRSVLELIDSNYTFLNEPLAKYYGVPGVEGEEMRRVELPEDSHRGGILTQGTVLAVTSNPTRTSPVKRGLFILDNILGTPPPPPPPDIPPLEESEKEFGDREPTLREVLEVHRGKPLCASCHSRMDPLGLALENFNAMGMWRDKERGQAIDSAGQLISGETFHNVDELKKILVNDRREDFYRCLTEKLLTYALGRGLEYYDTQTVDLIVERLEKEDGRFSALLTGIIESAPFQKRRNFSEMTTTDNNPDPNSRQQLQAKLEP